MPSDHESAIPVGSFGLMTPAVYPLNRKRWEDDLPAEQLGGIVRQAEHLGYGFVTVGDHGAVAVSELSRYGTGTFYDPVATLGFFAAMTSTIRLATYVYQVHLRSPLLTAKSFATLDRISAGRLIVGLGVGRYRYEAETAGVDFESRGHLADECIAAIKLLWSGAPVSFQGDLLSFSGLVCRPRPVQRPGPVTWIGGNGQRALRRAVALGDAWAPFLYEPNELIKVLENGRRTGLLTSEAQQLRIVVPISPWSDGDGVVDRGRVARLTHEAVRCLDGWRRVGATDFVVEFRTDSVAEFHESMAWFAEDVAPRAGLHAGLR
jgi:probable F420-dependent oxidoreductase